MPEQFTHDVFVSHSLNARRSVSRRAFLRATGVWGTSIVLAPALRSAGENNFTGKIMTVLGAIDSGQLGMTLSHEHAIVDFLGAEKAQGPRHDSEDAFATVLPHLKTFREHGGRALVECTPNYIGRDVRLLKRLAEASRLHVITNTGYYGASGNKFLPKHAFTESADQLSARWLAEWRDGIDGTGVRPGFLKLGVEKGKLSDVHTKLVRAAARVHHASGLPIAIHTGDGIAALDEVRCLREEAVAPAALIWVHAQNDPGPTHIEMAKLGAWVSLDGFNAKNRDHYTKFLTDLKREKLLSRVLLSHDHYWSVEGDVGRGSLKLHSGGAATAYESIFTDLLPHLRANGFSDDDIERLTVRNPSEAFAIRVRKL